MLSLVSTAKLGRILQRMLDPEEFLSPHGIRGLSRFHQDHPYVFEAGDQSTVVYYEPAESANGLFGGNSNWRGPIWMPINVLIVKSLRRFGAGLGADFRLNDQPESPPLDAVADDLSRRLVSLFLRDGEGRRPVFGGEDRFDRSEAWRDHVPFHEYFHGDTGAGLGASHQTGWTGLVVDLIRNPRA